MTNKEYLAEIDSLLSIHEKKIAKAFSEAIRRIKSKTVLARIVDRLKSGNYQGALAAAVDEAVITEAVASTMGPAMQRSFMAGGDLATKFANASRIDVVFNVTNPGTARYFEDYKASLVRSISRDTRRTLEAVLRRGVNLGQNPNKIARAIRDNIGLTPAQAQAVENYRDELENLSPKALDRELRDARYDRSVARAIAQGESIPKEKIDAMVGRYQESYVQFRSETIARTEAIRSLNAGNYSLWQQAIRDGKVRRDWIRRQWIYTHDAKVRPSHAQIPKMNPDGVGMDEPFQSPEGQILFPGDPSAPPEMTINCRCTQMIRVRVPEGQELR